MSPSFWSRFNLVGSPYDPRPIGSDQTLPLNLLAGRDVETDELSNSIRVPHRLTTVVGPPGTGTTSVVHASKLHLIGRTPAEPPLPLASLLRKDFDVTGETASSPILHIDCKRSGSWQTASVLAELLARKLAGLRPDDPWHLVLDGPTHAFEVAIGRRSDLKCLISEIIFVSPLSHEAVVDAIHRRYEFLRENPALPVEAPVADEMVSQLYDPASGNLRQLFSVLSRMTTS